MGTWNYKITGNDTFQDLYQNFFDLYNQGQNPIDISKQIQGDFAQMFNDHDDRNNCLFSLALAQWETKSLDPTILNQVKEIIETGNDFHFWQGLDAKRIEKRKKELDQFLLQILIERKTPKPRVQPKIEYSANQLLSLPSPDGQKTFGILESYANGEYKDTNSGITWAGGGVSVFYFYTQGKFVTARWLDSQTLEIRHDKSIEFTIKEEHFFFSGDQGIIKYIAE